MLENANPVRIGRELKTNATHGELTTITKKDFSMNHINFLHTAKGSINLAHTVQVFKDNTTTCFHLNNGEAVEFDNKTVQNWEWEVASVIPAKGDLHQLIECYIDDSDTNHKELCTELYDVIGWKTVGYDTLPVAIGAKHVFESPEKGYAVLNTKTGSVRIAGGHESEILSYDSLADYQRAEALKLGVIPF